MSSEAANQVRYIIVIARVARDLWQRKQTLSSGCALGLGWFTAINPRPCAITITKNIGPMVQDVTYVDVGPRHVTGEKRRFLKSENNNQNSESGEVIVFTLSPC